MALEDARNPLKGVSGPGKFAKRTDLEFQPDSYGQGVEMAAIKAGAPLAKASNVTPSQAPAVPTARGEVTPLYAPSSRRDEPITTGIPMGAGAGPEVLSMRQGAMAEKLSDTLAKLLPYDQTGEIDVLYQQALARGM